MAEKSALYPNTTWDVCLDFIKVIGSLKYKSVAYSEVAKEYGISSVTTKSFSSKISSAKQFGLITTANNTIQLTEVARSILYPTSSNVQSIEVACFKNPPLYEKLIDRYDGKALPTEEVLSNILMKEYSITQSAKDNAAHCFFVSAESLGLIQGGVLSVDVKMESDRIEENELPTLPEPIAKATQPAGVLEPDFIVQAVPTSSGKVAEIRVPLDADKEDLFLIRDMLRSIMRRKFHIDPDED